jgi:putative peptidoglycan lipid II flippase
VSNNRRIFSAAATIAALMVVVKVAVVIKELLIAWRFGTNDDLDAFLIAYILPYFAINLVTGAFFAAFMPTYIEVREIEGKVASNKLLSNVMTLNLVLFAIVAVLIVAGAPAYLPWLAHGFNPEKLMLTRHLVYALAPAILISGVVNLWTTVLNAGERFALPALSPMLTPLAVSFFIIASVNLLGIFALAAGMVGGAILEATFLGMALRRQNVPLLPAWHGLDPHLRQVIGQYLPMLAGSFMMGSTFLVDQAMAATLPSGSVAALNYGNKLIALPLGLATTALGTAVMPYFSKMVALRDWTSIRHTLRRYLWLVFIGTVPLTVILIWFAEPLVRIVFQRGAFTAQDTVIVARVQIMYSLQIPFYLAVTLVVRLISSLKANSFLMWMAIVNLIVNIVLDLLFIQWYGVAGIALSTAMVYLVSFTGALVLLNKRLGQSERLA